LFFESFESNDIKDENELKKLLDQIDPEGS
jgi:hypothetical protein